MNVKEAFCFYILILNSFLLNFRGIVPISYINIIVDLINVHHETAVTIHQNLLPDTYHKVLYTFQGRYLFWIINSWEEIWGFFTNSRRFYLHFGESSNFIKKNVIFFSQGQMEGDLSVAEAEVVRVIEKQNEDWYVVENSSGEAGLFPGNHLDPNTEFSGKALFDIEQLLAFKSDKNQLIKVSTNNDVLMKLKIIYF